MAARFSLRQYGIDVDEVHRNLSPAVLYEHALKWNHGSAITASGALVAMSGVKTGRSPRDKRIIDDPDVAEDVWWGEVNMKLEAGAFQINRAQAVAYLGTRDRLYVVDAFAGWDPRYRIKVRVVCARPYHALFMHDMLIRPSREQLEDFGEPDYVIFNAGAFPASHHVPGVTSGTSISLRFDHGEMVILGTEYAGEMKKGVFTIMNYLMPARGVLSMHCSATEGENGETSILFGLSGTGKTTLSADPRRRLIGDDEHCWTDEGIFNIEGGCYAKVIDLSAEDEPDIHGALRFGAVLENVVYDPETREVDYADTSITTNTRGAYPIEHIESAKIPCVGGHPKHVIFLTCDAFGVLPPVSRLTPEQAMYHFISGYTAKVAGTEVGVTEPEATFSPCFGGPFLVWHPAKYAELLAEHIRRHQADVWLVNTGWSGGAFGIGRRIRLAHTRAIVDAIHSGALSRKSTNADPVFGLAIPESCPGVPGEILVPRNTWADRDAHDATARRLARLFAENFKAYEDVAGHMITRAGPRVEAA
jgi:phosphoenolpyruvate carboxykinase (ATP)